MLAKGADVRMAICLTEMPGTNWFSEIESSVETGLMSGKKVDEQTLLMNIGSDTVMVYCASQVNSQEKIEVIVVGFRGKLPEGLALKDYVEKYGQDYLVIFPWGVGKWLGRRGDLLTTQMDSAEAPFVLGDNGGRPYWWARIPQFKKAMQMGVPVLAGSDTLPVSSFKHRVASYGNVYADEFTNCTDWINHVKGLRFTPPVLGKPSGTLSFLFEQASLRLNKRLKR